MFDHFVAEFLELVIVKQFYAVLIFVTLVVVKSGKLLKRSFGHVHACPVVLGAAQVCLDFGLHQLANFELLLVPDLAWLCNELHHLLVVVSAQVAEVLGGNLIWYVFYIF